MSHTPGPWTLVFDVDGAPGFIWGKTTCICDFGKDVPKPEDARLIAAAPEMYEALRDLFEAVVIPEEISIEAGCKARIRARDILLKLRGEEGGENA